MTALLTVLVSVGIPLGFLAAVRRLNLYASSFAPVGICFAAGLVAFPLSFVLNTAALRILMAGGMIGAVALMAVRLWVAPVVEEVCKSAGLVVAISRPDFTYFVDGAVCGFAGGTAFAVVENLFYV